MDCDACVFGVGQSVAQGSDYQLRKEAKTDSIKLTPPAKEGEIDQTFWEKMEKSYVGPTVGVPRKAWCIYELKCFECKLQPCLCSTLNARLPRIGASFVV